MTHDTNTRPQGHPGTPTPAEKITGGLHRGKKRTEKLCLRRVPGAAADLLVKHLAGWAVGALSTLQRPILLPFGDP